MRGRGGGAPDTHPTAADHADPQLGGHRRTLLTAATTRSTWSAVRPVPDGRYSPRAPRSSYRTVGVGSRLGVERLAVQRDEERPRLDAMLGEGLDQQVAVQAELVLDQDAEHQSRPSPWLFGGQSKAGNVGRRR